MQGKKSIIVYADWKHVFDQLDDAEAGQLIKHFFDYVNDLNPEPPSKLIKIAFEPIKQSLKRDLEKWEIIKEKRSIAGQISAQKRAEQNSTNSTHVESVQQNSTNSTVSVNDSVSVTVNDSVSEINNKTNTSPKTDVFDWDKFLAYFNQIFSKSCRIYPKGVKDKYKDLIKHGFTKQDIETAMKRAKGDKFHMENNYSYCTIEYFSRQKTIDRYANPHQPKKIEDYNPRS